MALPGLSSLPGLSQPSSTPQQSISIPSALAPPRTEELPARNELRFEVAANKPYRIRLIRGSAEIFGTELGQNIQYTFSGTKAAVFTWHGCTLELQGDAESEYIGSETDAMVEWMNLHGMLETLRDEASTSKDEGPRVLVVGPDSNGKSSLVKCLTSWAVRMGRTPTVINLDPREATLSIPSSLTATTYNTALDFEDNCWGSSSVSGPTSTPTKTPLVYHYPFSSPETNPPFYKALITRLALAVSSKTSEDDASIRSSGLLVDTPGSSLDDPKSGYDVLAYVAAELSINIILVMGSERQFNQLKSKFTPNPSSTSTDEPVNVLRLAPSPGAVARDARFMTAVRNAQIRSYFFGDTKTSLSPHSQMWDFADLAIYRAVDPSVAQGSGAIDFAPGADDDDDDDYDPAAEEKQLVRVAPSLALAHSVLAIKFAPGSASADAIRDACVMGFVYVADVDEAKKKIRFLAPHPNRWGDRALVWGPWPEALGDLVG